MKLILSLVLISGHAVAASDYHLETQIRQQQIDQRMGQIQRDMKAQSNAVLSSTTQTSRTTFSPTLPGYSVPINPPLRSGTSISKDKVDAFLEGLGSPEDGTGIYAYPPEERLYQYGLMCIEVGFVEEGVRAITDHLRISSENTTRSAE